MNNVICFMNSGDGREVTCSAEAEIHHQETQQLGLTLPPKPTSCFGSLTLYFQKHLLQNKTKQALETLSPISKHQAAES